MTNHERALADSLKMIRENMSLRYVVKDRAREYNTDAAKLEAAIRAALNASK